MIFDALYFLWALFFGPRLGFFLKQFIQKTVLGGRLRRPMSQPSPKPIYRVIFINQDQVFELYAAQIYQSDMYGFIEVEEFVFGERSQVLVDPSEEKLKAVFSGVKRSYIPMHAIIRIDEVEKEGVPTITSTQSKGGNVASFPASSSFYGKPPESSGGE